MKPLDVLRVVMIGVVISGLICIGLLIVVYW